MPRRPRLIVPGIAHHVTQRGNNREPVFLTDENRRLYLFLLSRQLHRHGVRLLGYCLMSNHVHLLAVPGREDSLSRALRGAHSEYALAINRAGERSGHLWQNRFFSCPLDERHLFSALRYVDLNPVRAGLVRLAWDWPWSSALAHATPDCRDAALDPRWVDYLGHWDRAEWREILAAAPPPAESEALRRATHNGQPLGSDDFVRSLERQSGRLLRVLPRGRPKKGSDAFILPPGHPDRRQDRAPSLTAPG